MHQRAVLLLAAIIAAFLVSGCGSTPRAACVLDVEGICAEATSFARYRACALTITGGRQLFDPGWVVGEEWVVGADRQVKVFLFVSDRNPDDGRHVDRLTRIRRPCDAAGGRMFDVERQDP